VIRNNTVVYNTNYGVHSANGTAYASITNGIFWGNVGGQLSNCTASYSCIQNGTTDNNNINTDPCFADDANDNYHIDPNSPCIDKGNTSLITDPNETDIDGEPRVVDGDSNGTVIVDMGADEFYHSPADFDGNNIVDFYDYAILANAWRTAAGEPNYNEVCDLADNNSIDYNDLALFCEDWLWQAGWLQQIDEGWLMGKGAGGDGGLIEGDSALSVSAESVEQPVEQTEELGPVDMASAMLCIEGLVDWLDELWTSGELIGWTEQEYLEFRQAIQSSQP